MAPYIIEYMEKSIDEGLICDNCGYYPIEPEHAHYKCPQCHMPTKCCEGTPFMCLVDDPVEKYTLSSDSQAA